MRRVTLTLLLACLTNLPGVRVFAQPPSPLESGLFSFPGALAGSTSAVSAGFADADRWLGDEPFANPAATSAGAVSLSPTLLRMSRQDLRARNRHFDEQGGFIDAAGASLGLPLGRASVWLYGYQPVLRLEDNAFERGDGVTQPAVIASHTEVREARAGLGASIGLGASRVGAAFEWTRRDDLYETREVSGSPQSGDRHVDFSGEGLGFQLGVKHALGDSGAGRLSLGAAARFLPALALDGEQRILLQSGDSLATLSADRESGWEGGVTASYGLSAEFRLLAAAGGSTAQAWEGFEVTSGAGFTWKLAGEFHDAREPWSLRFGFGQEQQRGVPEPRAGVFGIGLGWQLANARLDFGAVRRSLARADQPTSYDDRAVATVQIGF